MTATCSTAPEDDVRLRRSWALSERTAQRTLQQLLRQQQNLLDGGARGGNSYQSQPSHRDSPPRSNSTSTQSHAEQTHTVARRAIPASSPASCTSCRAAIGLPAVKKGKVTRVSVRGRTVVPPGFLRASSGEILQQARHEIRTRANRLHGRVSVRPFSRSLLVCWN